MEEPVNLRNVIKIKYFLQLPHLFFTHYSLFGCSAFLFQDVFYFTICKVLKANMQECIIFRKAE